MEQIMNMTSAALIGLGADATATIAVLDRLDPARKAMAMERLGFVDARRVWTPRVIGALPTLTELVPERDREAIYALPGWAAYRRAGTVVVYVLQAAGLARLSAILGGLSLAKVGSTAAENLRQRIADLGSDEYGAWVRGHLHYEHQVGFKKFEPAARLPLAVQHPASPIRLSGVGIEVDLPEGMTPERFEAALNRALLPIRLQTIADSEVGRDLCARTGVDPRQLARYYRRGTGYRAATELTAIRPQADLGALARLCADVVIDEVLVLRPKRPV